jgi:hypothetical protein
MNTERFPADLPAFIADFVPHPLAHLMSALHVLSTQGNDLTDDQLSNTAGVAERAVEHGNPALGSVFQVDLICADAKAPNTYEILSMLEDVLGQSGFGSYSDRLNMADLVNQLSFR